MTRQPVCAALALLLTGVLLLDATRAQEPAAAQTDAATAAKIHAALAKPTKLEFIETPLSDVATFIHELHGIDVTIDARALEEIGVGSDTPITLSLEGVSLRSGLRIMLSAVELDYTIRFGALDITTAESTESQLITRVYPVADLLDASNADEEDFDELIQAITSTIAVEYWDEVGGPASINGVLGNLVVSQTLHNHQQLKDFLKTYRLARKNHKAQTPLKAAYYAIKSSPAEERIRAQLDTRVTFEFVETPLEDVARFLGEMANIPILLNQSALEDIGLSTDAPITASAEDARLRDGLGRIFRPLDLAFSIRDETLQVTTQEELESHREVRLYPIYDMLIGEADNQAAMIDRVIGIITTAIQPDSWDEMGGMGSVVVLQPGVLAVAQTGEVQREVNALLTTLRSQGVARAPDNKSHITKAYAILDPAQRGQNAQPELVEKLSRQLSLLVPGVDWKEHGVFHDSLGSSIVVRHNRSAHRKTSQALQELSLYNPYRLTPAAMGVGMPGTRGFGGGGLGGGGLGGGGLGGGAKGGGMFSVPSQPAK